MADEKFEGLKLLGQELTWPKTVWGTLAVLFIVTGICVIVFTVVKHARELEPVVTTFMATRVDKGSVVETSARTYQIGFWTPSAKTKNAKAEDLADWEKIENDDKVVSFGVALRKDKRVPGYRRYEVNGTGRSGFKTGYWWIMTAEGDYPISEFVKTYQSHWNNNTSIYVEILRQDGRYER